MVRPLKPWEWRDRRGWYTTIDHRRRLLAADDEHGPERRSERAAGAAVHWLVAERRGESRTGETVPVGLLTARFLADVKAKATRGEVGPGREGRFRVPVPERLSPVRGRFSSPEGPSPADRRGRGGTIATGQATPKVAADRSSRAPPIRPDDRDVPPDRLMIIHPRPRTRRSLDR